MNIGSIIISFGELVLYCALIIFVAWLIVWGIKMIFGVEIDGNVFYWGRVIVGLLCAIAILTWLFAVLGFGGGGLPRFFPRTYSEAPVEYRSYAVSRTVETQHMQRVLAC